jgi:pyruvyltransferase
MKVFYCKNAVSNKGVLCTNFGDILTPYIFKHYNIPFIYDTENPDVFAIGSLIQNVPENFKGQIWTTGFIYPVNSVNPIHPPLAVRGLLTLKHFKCDVSKTVLGDGGLIISRIYKPNVKKKYLLGIMPHYSDIINMRDNPIEDFSIFQNDDILFIDPRDPVEKVIDNLNSCINVVTSSLHGIITCDSYGINHALFSARESQMSIHKKQDSFKFLDYYSIYNSINDSNNLESIDKFYFDENITLFECIKHCKPVNKPNIEIIKDKLVESLLKLKNIA